MSKNEMKEEKENKTEHEKKDTKHELKETKKFEKKISELEEEISNLKDGYLRKQAEFENFRKRLEKEKENFFKFANEDIMKDIVVFLDNLERAIESSKQSKDFNNLLEGITMIEKEILSSFEKKYNLVKFGEANNEFDPTLHEAISTVEKEELKNPEVVEVYQKGYRYNDRILRTAKVKVAQSKN